MKPYCNLPAIRSALHKGYERFDLAVPARVWEWICYLAVIALIFVLKIPVIASHTAPPGADPANLLSFAWGITGQSARLAPWAYPPLTYGVLRLLLYFFLPLTALKILGFCSWILLASALWIVLKRFLPDLSAITRTVLAVMLTGVSFTNEIYSFGGYPQLYGTAFLLVAITFEESYLKTGKRSDGIAAGLGFVGVVFTHHLLAALLPVLWAIVFLWTWMQTRSERRGIWQRWLKVSIPAVPSASLAAPFYWKYYSLLARSPLNPNGYSLSSLQAGLIYVFQNHAPLWLVLILVALAAAFILPRSNLSASVLAFSWGSLILFVGLWEIRILHLTIVGAILALAILFNAAGNASAKLINFTKTDIILRIAILLLGVTVVIHGQQYFINTAKFYNVLEDDLIPSVDWLRENTPAGDRVAVTNFSYKSAQMGWWIEGYGKRPAYYVGDPRWLSYTIEKQNTAIANQIFDPNSSADTIRELIESNQIRWIFMDPVLVTPGIYDLTAQLYIATAYDDDRVIIFKVQKDR